MQVYFCADPHLGHRNIHKFRDVVSCEQNTKLFLNEAWKKLNKRSLTFYLGDVAMDDDHLMLIDAFPGRRILVGGNHDDMTSFDLRKEVFEDIHGMIKYKEFWLSHCPIHPDELRGKKNIHGHVHKKTIPDNRYFNACVDVTMQYFISLQEVRAFFNNHKTQG
jgi:calcineurin-like phosphoesterase family protein